MSITKNISIPDSVPNMKLINNQKYFRLIDSIKTITLPNSVTSIEYQSFCYSKNLETITFPNSLTCVGYEAFIGCKKLKTITLSNSITTIIGYAAFENCISLETITLPNSLTSIIESSFAGCESLKTITLPNSVKSIREGAFWGCKNLKNIIVSTGIDNANVIYLLILSANKQHDKPDHNQDYNRRFLQLAMNNFFRYICKYGCSPTPTNKVILDTFQDKPDIKISYKMSCWL